MTLPPIFPSKSHEEASEELHENAQTSSPTRSPPQAIPSVSRPREKSPNTTARIRVKNRRKRYLDTHPEYFSSPSHELADPLSYDRLIRRFQSPAEREAEGRKKGYSGVLEADLWRAEAKVEAARAHHPSHHQAIVMGYRRGEEGGEIVVDEEEEEEEEGDEEGERDEVPASKEEGTRRWREEVEALFLRGGDKDFEYEVVDGEEGFDDRGVEEREVEERWFEEEEPCWVGWQDGDGVGDLAVRGQTGVQDF